jgi:hypothetical protein
MTSSTITGVTGGVDTHSRVHVAAVVATSSQQLLGTRSFPASSEGYTAMLVWLQAHGEVDAVGIGRHGHVRSRSVTPSVRCRDRCPRGQPSRPCLAPDAWQVRPDRR